MLRDVRESDLESLFEHQRDPESAAMAVFLPRGWDEFLTHWRTKILADAATEVRVIALEGEVVGYVSSWQGEGKRLVAYWIGREFWGRGIATSALGEFLAAHEPRRPIHAYVARTNVRSIRVLEKCGFRRCDEPSVGTDGVDEILLRLDGAA